jgi:hypothetical protein
MSLVDNNTSTSILKFYKMGLLKTTKRILKESHKNLIDYFDDNHVLTFSLHLDVAEQHIKTIIEINEILEKRGEL